MVWNPYVVECSDCGITKNRPNRSKFFCKECSAKRGLIKEPFYPRAYYYNRKIVFERDNYKCQSCGDTKKILAHHIDCDRFNNSPSNLITLCNQCHMSLHGTYTKEQLRKGNIYKMLPKEFIWGEEGKRTFYKHYAHQFELKPKEQPKFFIKGKK